MSKSPPLLLPYALVGKRASSVTGAAAAVVLAEFAFDSNGPFPMLGRELLENPQYKATAVEGYSMLSLDRDGLCFIVAAKQQDPSLRTGREALQLISSSFAARIGLARARGATRRYAFNVEFAPILQRHLEKFSRVDDIDVELQGLSVNLEQAKDKAKRNIHHLVDRGSKMDALSRTSEQLSETSTRFHSAARELRRLECWQAWRTKMVFGGACIVVFIMLLMVLFR